MATISITAANDRESNYSPASGDRYELSDLASFIMDRSTPVTLSEVEFNSVFQEVTLENTSTTTPNIIRLNTSGLDGQNGVLTLDGLLIDIATADGSPSQVIQFPADSLGAYPSFIGYCYIGADRYTQITSFTNIRNDFRGYHFTYDNVTGQMTFGDGVNGALPTGTVSVENIYVESNGSLVNLRDGNIRGNGHCVFIDSSFSDDPNITVQSSWGIVNNSTEFKPYRFFKHKYSELFYLGVGSGENVRVLLAEDTAGDEILFQTESSASTEVFQNENVPMWGVHEARFVAQRGSDFPRTRMYNNGGNATLKIYQGRGSVFSPYGGIGGTWRIIWSDGYKTSDLSPFRIIYGRYDCDTTIFAENVGGINWSGERGGMTMLDFDIGKYKVGSFDDQLVIPAGVLTDEIVNTSGAAEIWIDGLDFRGVASSGTRDFNLNSPVGTLITNFSAPNDVDHGNQPEPNTTYRFASFIGNDPAFSSGMNHSIVLKNTARDLAQIWFMPHAIAPNGSILSGDAEDLIYSTDRVFYSTIGLKTETLSDTIEGCGIATSVTIKGFLTSNFAVEYKLWEKGTAEPASYKTFNTTNVQADQAGFTTATRWSFKYTVEKISGNANAGYIQGIYIDCPADSSFEWQPDAEPMTVVFNDMQVGDYIRLEDALGVTQFYQQATQASETILIDAINDGDTWRRAVDREGYSPDVGNIAVVAGETLPISVSLFEYKRRDGQSMYSGSTDPAISVSFDLNAPQATITINDAIVLAQDIFNAVEIALLTEDGMAWHSQQGSIVQWDDIIQGGKQLYLGSGWRLFGIGLNAGVKGIVTSVDSQIFAAGSSQMVVGDGYEEYTQADRDRDDAIKTRVDLIPANPLLDNDARLDSYSTFNPSTDAVEGSETYDEALRLIRAEAAGKVAVSGDQVVFRDAADTKDRILATTDSSGQRTAVTTDGS